METSNEDFGQMLHSNLIGHIHMIRHVVPLMSVGGHIVNVSSMGGFKARPSCWPIGLFQQQGGLSRAYRMPGRGILGQRDQSELLSPRLLANRNV